ncbi:MAG: ATP-binding protein, partial [Thermoplasmata archaeon]
ADLGQGPLVFERRVIPLEPGSVYLLRGPRQVGKSTLIKQHIRELIQKDVDPHSIMYYPCDYVGSVRELRRIIEFHLERNRGAENLYIFLDEITYLRNWNREIKAQVDAGLLRRAALILTGSGAAQLRRQAEQLPGRGLEGNQYLLYPLTFREFLLQASDSITKGQDVELMRSLATVRKRLEDISFSLEDSSQEQMDTLDKFMPYGPDLDALLRFYLMTGGFPQTINRFARASLKSIEDEAYNTMMQVVLGDFSKQGKEEALARQIIEGILRRHGTRFSYPTLTNEVDATHPTVLQYLETLNDSLLTQTIYSIDFKRGTSRYKADKKVYLSDPFLYHSTNAFAKGLEGFPLSVESLDDETILSSLVESVVASHLTQTRVAPYLAEPMTFLYFFYNPRKEVDFVYRKKSGEFTGIEVKYGRQETKYRFPNISQLKERIILTRDSVEFDKDEPQAPVALFLSLLDKSPSCL